MSLKSVLKPIWNILNLIISKAISPFSILFFFEPLFLFLGIRGRSEKNDILRAKRILVIRLDHVGDVVLTIPFLRELRSNTAGSWITLIVRPQLYNLLEKCPSCDEILTFDPTKVVPGPLGDLIRRFRMLKFSIFHLWQKKYELAIQPRWFLDLQDASFLAYFSGAKKE